MPAALANLLIFPLDLVPPRSWWEVAGLVVTVGVSAFAIGHVVMRKRDHRAAVGWAGVIVLVPLYGAILYWILGINRVQRRARLMRRELTRIPADARGGETHARRLLGPHLPSTQQHLGSLAEFMERVVRRELVGGNRLEPLIDGDEAYPRMLEAIDAAEHSVSLCSYIFEWHGPGERFVEALRRARERGVAVRVMVDAIGERYGWPPIRWRLRSHGIPSARFNPTLLPRRFPYMNLRSHRKLLVVDGRVGFTGGINVRSLHLARDDGPPPVRDLHFRIEGPVVRHLQETFAEDWNDQTGELLSGPAWFPEQQPQVGHVVARGIADGPDEDFDQLRWSLLGALSVARRSVCVVTPYFLPDASLATELQLAAMRGLEVDIVLPRHNNLALVQWASTTYLEEFLERGCRIWLTEPTFDHTKLMLVDGGWVLLGSGNWDPRSLRLNFEFNLECYDLALADRLSRLVEDKLERAHRLTIDELRARPWLAKLRDNLARLASPYL